MRLQPFLLLSFIRYGVLETALYCTSSVLEGVGHHSFHIALFTVEELNTCSRQPEPRRESIFFRYSFSF